MYFRTSVTAVRVKGGIDGVIQSIVQFKVEHGGRIGVIVVGRPVR
jgi:hypothetical protein